MPSPQSNIANTKVVQRWCDSCGTLVLGRACACGAEPREFEVNGPGDVRPCMGDTVGLVLGLLRDAFGTAAPLEGRSLFLNKIPGEDRADEVIAHGEVVAVLRFELERGRHSVELRQAGAEIFAGCATKGVVAFGSMPGHLKGKAVPGDRIREVAGPFGAGAPLILKKGSKVGAGVALAPSSELASAERAVRVRDIAVPRPRPLSPPCGREGFVRCNAGHLRGLESAAAGDIRSFVRKGRRPVTVSFSGGKDSLAALGVTLKAVRDPELIFVDTGLEFPETVSYVRRFAERSGLRLHAAEAGDAFRRNVGAFGPPAKDFRWCCKVCKLGPVTELIARDFPGGTVTVEGNRMLESYARSRTGFVSKNPFVPNQTTLNPIRAWRAADVWGYIWMRGLEYNPLYERDFERIGCYLCASCLSSEWSNTKRLHPDMHAEWDAFLRRYAEGRGLPPEYVDMGFWRWKVLPPKMVRLAEGLDLRTEPDAAAGPSVTMLKGATVCAAGGYSVEAVVSVPRRRGFDAIAGVLRTVGDVRSSEEFEIALVRSGKGTAKVFGGGQVSVVAPTGPEASRLFERAAKAILRAQMCTECGICARTCPRHAITLDGGLHVDPARCDSCGRCEASCMVAHYYDKIVRRAPPCFL